jgi:hypothetical protein
MKAGAADPALGRRHLLKGLEGVFYHGRASALK